MRLDQGTIDEIMRRISILVEELIWEQGDRDGIEADEAYNLGLDVINEVEQALKGFEW